MRKIAFFAIAAALLGTAYPGQCRKPRTPLHRRA